MTVVLLAERVGIFPLAQIVDASVVPVAHAVVEMLVFLAQVGNFVGSRLSYRTPVEQVERVLEEVGHELLSVGGGRLGGGVGRSGDGSKGIS